MPSSVHVGIIPLYELSLLLCSSRLDKCLTTRYFILYIPFFISSVWMSEIICANIHLFK